MLGTARSTERGFPIVEFNDSNNESCSIQCSSAIDDSDSGFENPGTSFLWIGINDPNPKIMCSKAESIGVPKTGENGWQEYPLPEEVLITSRMHLNRDQVIGLIERLNNWLNKGSF